MRALTINPSVPPFAHCSTNLPLLPSPFAPPPAATKSHYTFNLRDISRVMQGFLMMTPDQLGAGQVAKDKYLRLWVHEVRGSGLAG